MGLAYNEIADNVVKNRGRSTRLMFDNAWHRRRGSPLVHRLTLSVWIGRGERGPRRERARRARERRWAPQAAGLRGPPRNAVHRSAAPCSPTGLPRSTIGAGRLSFRVRNGTGRAPAARAADRWAAFRPPGTSSACPGGRTASLGRPFGGRGTGGWVMRRARAISAARLRPSPTLHLRPINQVVYLGPYRKEN